ncbi:uncharacterized protein LOC132202638 isoform X2 [Neocloeon triangulifer]|uniref:uncharacterized protein LOC132202638 isoform X2 n=1 Tax=Neocloeon triangulifer TaxID=2078957 RepID=UPI00286F387E|nr:uncharacterized protein LOC132202638 isoform X2 [Neocloeon triangulifer]
MSDVTRAVIVIGGLCVVGTVAYYMGRKSNMQIISAPANASPRSEIAVDTEDDEIAEVLFFPDVGYACNDFLFNPTGCRNDDLCLFLHERTSLGSICVYLQAAEISINVCMYTLSSSEIVSSLLCALDNGVTVRILIDYQHAITSAANTLRKLGIRGALIYEARSNFMMHNKFAIIDKKIIMTGSFNWTLQGSNGNYENVVILSKKKLVQKYCEQFEQLWEDFADLNVPSHPSDNPDLAFNPLKNKIAWDGIIVGYEAPKKDGFMKRTRPDEPSRKRL